jgi:hypothetical protein
MALKPSYTWHDGFAMPMGFSPRAFRSARTYVPEPGDFFIATYPKCGTTWAQHIVYLIAHCGAPLPPTASMGAVIPHLEEVGAEAVCELPAPRTIKTHLPFGMAPYSEHSRYLHIARNPFDCAVSFYHHTRGFPQHYKFADGTFDEFFECFLAGDVDFGDYFDHLTSWRALANAENCLLMTYEGMSADPRAAVLAIAEFMGADGIDDSAVLTAILTHSSFASMSKDQQRWSSRRPDGMPAFVRKGRVGDWRNHFSLEQAGRLLEKCEQHLSATHLDPLWSVQFDDVRRLLRGHDAS